MKAEGYIASKAINTSTTNCALHEVKHWSSINYYRFMLSALSPEFARCCRCWGWGDSWPCKRRLGKYLPNSTYNISAVVLTLYQEGVRVRYSGVHRHLRYKSSLCLLMRKYRSKNSTVSYQMDCPNATSLTLSNSSKLLGRKAAITLSCTWKVICQRSHRI